MQFESNNKNSELEARARDGEAAAQFSLGQMCESGNEMPRDQAAAFEWFRKAAAQGLAEAQFQLGVKYQRVGGFSRDGSTDEARIEAYKWFKLAANQGLKKAATHRDLCTLGMTRDEVAEGNRRAAGFESSTPVSAG